MKPIKLIPISLFGFLTISCHAQKSLQATMMKIESQMQDNVIFSEKRNPDTKKVYRENRIISFSNDDYQKFRKMITEAVEKDRPNASNFSILHGNTYSIQFDSGKISESYFISPSSFIYNKTNQAEVLANDQSFFYEGQFNTLEFNSSDFNSFEMGLNQER